MEIGDKFLKKGEETIYTISKIYDGWIEYVWINKSKKYGKLGEWIVNHKIKHFNECLENNEFIFKKG